MKKIFYLAPIAFFCLSNASIDLINKKQLIYKKNKCSEFSIIQNQDLVFETTTLDFGKIDRSSDGRREFKFSNTSKKPISIDEVRTSCGCIAIIDYPHVIGKGATGIIKLEYDTNRVGPFTKTITLSTSGSQKEIVLIIKGIVN